MREDMTLEQEFDVRETACGQVFELVEGLNKTIDFYYDKCWFVTAHPMLDPSFYEPLRNMVMMEMHNLAERFDQLSNMTKDSLLPLDTRNPIDVIAPYVLKVDNFKPHNLGGKCLKVEADVYKVYEQMFMAMSKYKNQYYLSIGNNATALFEQLMQRYVRENGKMLDDYIEDIDDIKEAKAELKKDFKGKVAVEVWIKSGRDVKKTINELAEKGCVEKDLLPLLEYKAKYDRLTNAKKSVSKASIAVEGDNNGIVAERINVGLSKESEKRLVDGILNKKQLDDGNRD